MLENDEAVHTMWLLQTLLLLLLKEEILII